MSRRAKIALWTVAILVVIIIALVQLTGVYVNWLWFGEVGFHSVYTKVFWTRLTLFFVFGVLMALILGGNLVISYLLSPPFRPMSAEQQSIERYRAVLEPRRLLILSAITVIALFAAGVSAQDKWATWQLWLNGGSFGQKDPQFKMDVSFYAWDLPVYRLLLGFGFTAIIFAFIMSVLVHYLTGAIRLQTPGPKVTLAARRHLTILGFVFIVLKAIAYWLDRFSLVFSDRSTFTGASYTDVHAVLPARTILFWIAIVIAAGLLASLWLRSTLLPGIAFISMLVMSVLISGIYPATLQQFTVKPNASSKEAPYIERNITATREAYGISSVKYVNDYASTAAQPASEAITSTNPTVSDIRILDPNLLNQTFTQLQQVKNVYGFAPKLDVDRYTIDGKTNDYIVGIRELDAANLKNDQANWINEHTNYTHGYGFVAAAANENVTDSNTPFSAYDIPTTGPLAANLTQNAAYYGELLPNYSIVGARGTTQEYDASGAKKVRYTGSGGVSLSNVMTRLAFAVKYKQTNFLLNDAASASGAKIIFNRDPRERVKKVAPYLTVDGDPYPIIDTGTANDPSSGHLVWMVDAYTTMANFPYSQRNTLSDLTADSLSSTGKTAGQPDAQINYIRNSVKATVDAYTGKVTLYAWDPTDPVLKAWMKVFPGTVKSAASMPSSIKEHVRYPQDLFEVQRSLLGTYHVSNPVTFYNQSDKWTVPDDPARPSSNQPPFYVLASVPGEGSTAPQFQLTTPMIVNSRNNMAAYISVNSDPPQSPGDPEYGAITVLRVPSNSATLGPGQVANILNTETTISQNLSLLEGAGSTVLKGNLLTLPVGNTFLYVEPLYVQGTGATGAFPVLQRVLVVYRDAKSIGFEPTLADALNDLKTGKIGVNLGTGPLSGSTGSSGGSSSTSTPTSSPSSGSPSSSAGTGSGTVGSTLQALNSAQSAVDAAVRTGNETQIEAAIAYRNQVLNAYLAAQGATTSPPASGSAGSGSASSSASASASPSR